MLRLSANCEQIYRVKWIKLKNKNTNCNCLVRMPTHLLHMTQNAYPFGQSQQQDQSNRVLVKQVISKSSNSITEILRTAKTAKKISQNKTIVKIQTVMQEDESICLLYEYVPIRMSKYINSMDDHFLKQYRNQLFDIADTLAENRIIANIQIENMGLNEKYQPKYFLGMNFIQKKQVNIYELKNDYLQQIKRIFTPYLNCDTLAVNKKTNKNLVKVDNRMSDTQQIQNVSSYIDSTNNLIKTRKHQSIYYQKNKDQQVKRRKQSYMSSVSNLRLNNLYRRINEIELQVCNTKTPSKNGFKFSIEGRQFTSKSSLQDAKKTLQSQKLKTLTNNAKKINPNPNSYALVTKNNFIKYPGYDNEEEYSQQFSQFQQYEQSIRSNKPNRYAGVNPLEMSAHTKPIDKKPYKKFSTQFPTLSDFQQPLMALTSALRISANGLDRNQRKVNKKIQMFKEREYSEMKSVSGNTNYMRDFMSVLEEETSTNERTSKNNENENQSQQQERPKHKTIKVQTQELIDFMPFHSNSNQNQKKHELGFKQNEIKTYSHNQIPASQKIYQLPSSYQDISTDMTKLRTKPSIQQSITDSNIHSRVKGAIQNSKKLIQKLKQKAKKNV